METGSKEYLTFPFSQYLFSIKHSLQILCKSEHFPHRYNRKCEWVFFSEHSVLLCCCGGRCTGLDALHWFEKEWIFCGFICCLPT